ncbi:hypothetical protein [Spirochaeta isovalerica]|uniref:Uncharacterized protein n=1 Tax=Spirochaeta isovalerica TaxID=150 RepID=A0A841RDR3_9SPIO|nr:hypothetical protein [Spirochaeta isovalerica]MBB6480989.1 hypothetical protein [Spirochaeta isovalerica]
MKKTSLLVTALLFFFLFSSAALSVDEFHYAYGQWEMQGNRLVQKDLLAGMARVDIPFPQEGTVVYDFNVRYEDGGTEDLHAGFGIHLFVNNPAPGKAWGNDKSYLLWLNYDTDPSGITNGLSAQVYKSLSHHEMELVADYDLNRFASLLTNTNKDATIPVKLEVNSNTGDVKIADPMRDGWVYKFNLGNAKPLNGKFISLRTNSGSFSFGY